MKTTSIVWNGCDNYIISNESVFTQREEFKPFEAIEIDINELPIVDGEPDLNGVFGTECGKYFRAL